MNHKTLSEGVGLVCGAMVGFISPAQFGSDALKTVLLSAIGWGTARLLTLAAAKYRLWRNEKAAK